MFLCFCLLWLTTKALAQSVPKAKSTTINVVKKTFPLKGNLVTVTDWYGIGNWYMENYWASNKTGIAEQIGAKVFEQVKKNGDENKWSFVFKERLDTSGNDITPTKFKKLKLYQISKFTNTVNGEEFDEIVILRVPYKENKNIFPDSDWSSDIYFILKASEVTLLKK